MSTRALRRKLWINLALIAAAGVLVILVAMEPGREPVETPEPITGMKAAEVRTIRIETPGSAPVGLQKADDGWRMVEPRELPANAGKLDNLLAVTGAESWRRYAAADLDLEAVDLDGDTPTLILDDVTLEFGDTDPINGWRYIRVGDTVHLVNDGFFHLLRQDPLYWADNRLLPAGARVSALTLPERRVYRDEKGRWQAEPAPAIAGGDSLVSLVQRWEEARALSVKPLEGELPPSAPEARVSLESGETVTFRLLEPGNGVFLARPDLGLRYALTETQRDDLLRVPEPSPPTGDNADPEPEAEPADGPG